MSPLRKKKKNWEFEVVSQVWQQRYPRRSPEGTKILPSRADEKSCSRGRCIWVKPYSIEVEIWICRNGKKDILGMGIVYCRMGEKYGLDLI